MAGILVKIEGPDNILYFITKYDQYRSLINDLRKDQVQFEEMPSSEFHWLKKGERWWIPFYVVFFNEFPTEYVKKFQGSPINPLQDS